MFHTNLPYLRPKTSIITFKIEKNAALRAKNRDTG